MGHVHQADHLESPSNQEETSVLNVYNRQKTSVDTVVCQCKTEMAWATPADWYSPCSEKLPQINVTFNIDANAILNVSVHDKGTGKQQQTLVQWIPQ